MKGDAVTPEAHEAVRAQFARTAAAYVESAHHAKGAELSQMVALAGDVRGRRVLDVATGGGHTALAFARAGAQVWATDLTPEMLSAAQAFVAGTDLDVPVAFGVASAEALPFPASSFEVVTCRIAAHHFAAPRQFLAEAVRVLRPGGWLLLVDNVAPEERGLAAVMNEIERRRDPSHAEAYSVATWVGWLAEAGLELHALSRWTVEKPYAAWLARAQTPPEVGEALAAFVLGLPEAQRRYFQVVEQGGRLETLSHEAALFGARKPRQRTQAR